MKGNIAKEEGKKDKKNPTICRLSMCKSQTALFPFICDTIEGDDVNEEKARRRHRQPAHATHTVLYTINLLLCQIK